LGQFHEECHKSEQIDCETLPGMVSRVYKADTIMRHTTSKKIFTYWNNLRGNRFAPERTEIEPSDIRDVLGDTFILEVDHTYRTISFRLAGTKLCSSYGRELKNVGYLGLWDETDNMKIFDAVKQVYEQASPVVIAHLAETEQKQFLEYETLLLPLSNGTSQTVRILGTAAPSSIPSWVGVDAIINNRIKSVRKIPASMFQQDASLVPSLKDMTINEEAEQSPRRVGHLTILDGGKS
jgi:hypothetical protein